MMFKPTVPLSDVANNILKKRYFSGDETSWEELVNRVVGYVLSDCEDKEQVSFTREMLLNRYFLPNSPCLVNAGKQSFGLLACFVVPFEDSIEGIIETKGNFMRVAKKGGGCGTTLTHLRPEGSFVSGSTHGYAGGPVKFADTVSHDMDALTQAGFRSMAIMLTMSIYHPDIVKFITAKSHEDDQKIENANMSVTVDSKFMELLNTAPDTPHKVHHKAWGEGYLITGEGGSIDPVQGTMQDMYEIQESNPGTHVLTVQDVFSFIVGGAWRNGEPGILFYERLNDSPYKYTNQEIEATNPCAEQPLPPYGSCNLGSLDISKFIDIDAEGRPVDLNLLGTAVRLGVRFLDEVITKTAYPSEKFREWAMNNRPIGLGIMGFADYLLKKETAYGSAESLEDLEFIMDFIYEVANDASIELGKEKGIPDNNLKLPNQRRNVTLTTIAPTGTVSLIAGCSSGIEPVFSEIVIRNDKTGSYKFENDLSNRPYFRCAVSANGAKEVTWKEHLLTLNSAQKFVDSGVSKTINCPSHTRLETIEEILKTAYQLKYIKGLTVYRNGSRKVEVLTPKAVKKDVCPKCKSDLTLLENGIRKCIKCDFEISKST